MYYYADHSFMCDPKLVGAKVLTKKDKKNRDEALIELKRLAKRRQAILHQLKQSE